MNILVIDTATEACSVALEVQKDEQFETIHRFEICPQEHSKKLLPMVQEVLQAANTSLSEIDYLGVGVGPGSFTGVRIAMGMIQGLSFGTQLPIVKISTLQAMAQQSYKTQGATKAVSLIDARMSEVYYGAYTADDNGVMQLQGEELVIPPAELIFEHLSSAGDFAFAGTGWQAYEAFQAISGQKPEVLYPCALYMLPMAKQQIAQQITFKAAEIEPTYLRDKVTWKKLPGR